MHGELIDFGVQGAAYHGHHCLTRPEQGIHFSYKAKTQGKQQSNKIKQIEVFVLVHASALKNLDGVRISVLVSEVWVWAAAGKTLVQPSV